MTDRPGKRMLGYQAALEQRAAFLRDHPDKVELSGLELFCLANLADLGVAALLVDFAGTREEVRDMRANLNQRVATILAVLTDEEHDKNARQTAIRLIASGQALLDSERINKVLICGDEDDQEGEPEGPSPRIGD